MTGQPLLELRGLDVRYGDARAVRGIDLTVAEGEVVAVLGPNGAGKSSIAQAISGAVPAASGTIRFAGRDITRWSPHRRARAGIAHLPEERGVFPTLSVIDNVKMAVHHAVARTERRAAISAIFERFPVLGERRRQLAGTLSGGEQQMLALGRILVAPPRMLVADELSFGLAPLLIEGVYEAIAEARTAGITIMLIEQYVDRALMVADRAVVVSRGRIVWDGPASSAPDHIAAHYLGD